MSLYAGSYVSGVRTNKQGTCHHNPSRSCDPVGKPDLGQVNPTAQGVTRETQGVVGSKSSFWLQALALPAPTECSLSWEQTDELGTN